MSSSLAAAATLGAWRRTNVLRIRTAPDDSRPDVERGLAFGFAEASRSAALFGWVVQRIEAGDADAIVTTAREAASGTLPVLLLTYDPAPAANAFCVAADPAPRGPVAADCTVEVWHRALERFGAEQLNARYVAFASRPMTSDAWLGWFSIKVLTEAALRAKTTDPAPLIAYLGKASFDGHKGAPLLFDAQHHLPQPLYEMCFDAKTRHWRLQRELSPDSTPGRP